MAASVLAVVVVGIAGRAADTAGRVECDMAGATRR